jgi:hypothetical protein
MVKETGSRFLVIALDWPIEKHVSLDEDRMK